MSFPSVRLRRLRRSEAARAWVGETNLKAGDLIMPLFVRHGRSMRRSIGSMPGQFQLSADQALKEVRGAWKLGIRAVILFGIPARKDAAASEAFDPQGIVQTAIREIKKKVPAMTVIADCCACEYTSHGHCGIARIKPGKGDFILDNDATLELLARISVAQARAGADVIAPSGMIDGMVKTIRTALDRNGFSDRVILSYAAKYASAFYGPFREAAEGAPQFGDRRSYQMDPGNAREAMREVELDLEEGADIVMVKPALAYLDIVRRVRDKFNSPVAAYNVSGEYAMVKAAAANGWLDEKKVMMEILTSIKRAGADFILTYHAMDAARILKEKSK